MDDSHLIKVFKDPLLFIESFLWIYNKDKKRFTKFVLNEEQRKLLKALQEYRKIIILKPRKIGVSSLLRAWSFYKAFISPEPKQFAVISYERESADELHKIDKAFLDYLPEQMHRKLSKSSVRSIVFDDTKASIQSFTGRRKGGLRSYTFTIVHLSEFAYYPDQESLLVSVDGTVGDSGQIIIETTPNIPGDRYNDLVSDAQDGNNDWHLVTFWWWEHSGYTDSNIPNNFILTEEETILKNKYKLTNGQLNWRRKKITTLGYADFLKEYPGCIEDAFASIDTTFIPQTLFADTQILEFDTPEKIYEPPVEGEKYAIGVDIAEGRGQDYSSVHVVSKFDKRIMYHWRSNKIVPEALPDKILEIHKMYNDAEILCESNSIGYVTLVALRDKYQVKNLWTNKDGEPWKTLQNTKYQAMVHMREVISNGQMLREIGRAHV